METVIIDNGVLCVEISSLGAEVVSIKKDGKDKLWCGDAKIWKGHSPILFPICGGLLGDYFIYNGKEYKCPKHGFAKFSEFEVVSKEKTSATFMISYTEETLKVYPFKFNFKVHFKLLDDKLCVYYIVENIDNKAMYFNVGCHEAYALNGDFEDYSIYFEDDKVLKNTLLGKNLLANEAFDINLDNGSLKLDYDAYFTGNFDYNGETYYKDSIIVDNVKSKRAVMSYKGEEQFSIYYQDFRNLVIWTNSKGFLAIEPWSGLPDFASTDHKIENKRSIDKLAPNESKTFYHSITFN